MKKFISVLLTITLVTAACSDFTNSGNDKRTPQGPGTENKPAGSNPLPTEYQKPNEGPFSEAKMLVNIGMNVIVPAVNDLAIQSASLHQEVLKYCEALEADVDVQEHEDSAKAQWQKAMLAYHFLDAAPVGPLTDDGRFLADYIYSWPYLNICGIDQEVVKLDESNVPNHRLVYNLKGLGALEYLLFEPTLTSTCNRRANPKVIAWMDKPSLEKKADRCAFARVLTEDLVAKTKTLENRWNLNEGNFTKTLIDGSRYTSVKEATNAMTDALFAIEKVKDQRLGRPLGRHKDCISESGKCVELAEHLWSGLALRSVEEQLKGFQAVFFGSKNPREIAYGFDDFLAQQGQPQVAERLKSEVQDAIASAKALSQQGTFQEQLDKMDTALCAQTTKENRKEALCGLHEDVRAISTSMKIDVLTILSLRAPPVYQGDND